MTPQRCLVLLLVPVATITLLVTAEGTEGSEDYSIPTGFLVGAGVSAVQTEGSWNRSGKAESVADRLLFSESLQLAMNFSGDSHEVAANSYVRYKEDVAAAKALKLKLYRFSISWARVLPYGDPTRPNQEGVQYYRNLIKEILANDMTPMVTLYHFDHPQTFQDQFLGWESKEMVDKFVQYADFAFEAFGDDVTLWTTLNEPNQYCLYFNMLFVVGQVVKPEKVDINRCMHHAVLAHMAAYRLYKQKYFNKQKGQVGFTALLVHAQPATTSQEDIYAAEVFNQAHCGRILHAVVYGDYPRVVKKLYKKLPEFSKKEKEQLKGSTDFLGLNIYNGMTAKYNESRVPSVQVPIYTQLVEDIPFVEMDDESKLMAFDRIEPEVMKRSLLWAWEQYGVPLMITENGYGGVEDQDRAAYLSAYLRSIISTVHHYGVRVMGYCVWSLIDAFEWSAGYRRPFGLVHIDYEMGSLNRTVKEDSSRFLLELASSKVVPFVAPKTTNPPTQSTTTMPTDTSTPRSNAPRTLSGPLALLTFLLALFYNH